MANDAIHIDGLAEFARKLRRIDTEAPKRLRVALNTAAQTVINAATPQVPTRTGRARRSLKVRSTRTAVRIAAGGKTAPYYPWLDWGGRVGRGKSVRRQFIADGRYLYPAYYHLRDSGRLAETLTRALVDTAEAAGLKVTHD